MNKGDLFVTPTNQERLIIGTTKDGSLVYATRGGNTTHDYDRCEIQTPERFSSVVEKMLRTVNEKELNRVREKFANYIKAKEIQ
jgi:hypothetical protein